MHVSQSCAYTYGRHTASHDRVAMKLSLGYKYFWKVGASPGVCCVLYAAPRGHTLRHYIMECPLIPKFRPQGQHDLYSLIDHLLDSTTPRDNILEQYPHFAPRLLIPPHFCKFKEYCSMKHMGDLFLEVLVMLSRPEQHGQPGYPQFHHHCYCPPQRERGQRGHLFS
ncbi:hypothetical protein E2C01_002528 [Portunus trituberculatus]|uniref:Uncharacterized protein n=1 Tax=Portunus trituberculatus TaxID=210409 RepID=A0A5B7CK59_PORTR|nr:hypothetical protein [Portunus trituberculatus]